jgi:hypothetical protein
MDMARGSLLLQLWTDTNFLTPPEREQLATFIDLFRANPACFGNSRFVIGDPNNAEPYGYCCTDGKKAFLSIANACLKDSLIELEVGPKWGMPEDGGWDLYRWYPNPARLTNDSSVAHSPSRLPSVLLRPYEVALLEVVPEGERPSLGRSFVNETGRTSFAEPSVPVSLKMETALGQTSLSGSIPGTSSGGLFLLIGGSSDHPPTAMLDGQRLELASVWPKDAYWPCPWTAWRAQVEPAGDERSIVIALASGKTEDWSERKAYMLPR